MFNITKSNSIIKSFKTNLILRYLNINHIEDFYSINNKKSVDNIFNKCIKGYHLINSSPINEKTWEHINILILSSLGIEIYSKSNGNHLSGMDIDCSIGKLSNKSSKYYKKGYFSISSYRLTTLCDNKNNGNLIEIMNEINKKNNFDYYSFIIRDEKKNIDNKSYINYDWLLIPSNHNIFNPIFYDWQPTVGKKGKNKGSQIGWSTNEMDECKMSIVFSMSSQLWIHIKMTNKIKKFVVSSVNIENKPIYNYIDITNKLSI